MPKEFAFSPFEKELRELQPEDLVSLKQVSEGWYIEYKREEPKAPAIAKSLSAFANTYGGWLFIGIVEESKENPVAGDFLGIAKQNVDATLQRMRKAVADLINPSLYFESKVLWGPVSNLGLLEDRAIICVWVPRSYTAPHVHKKGVIYRRVSDASEPKPENDRFVLDQLWRRGDDIRRKYKEWYDRDPEFSKGEESVPYVRLMIVADKWSERNVWIDADENKIHTLFNKNDNDAVEIPFETIHRSAEGFTCRQLSNNDPHNLTLTWRLQNNLVSDVIIPLPLYQPSSLEVLRLEMLGYSNTDQFISVLTQYKIKTIRVVDLNFLFRILMGVAAIQRRLCAFCSWSEPYHIKMKALNVWRTMPFVDISKVLDRFEEFGPPMCLDSVVSSLRGTGPESFLEIPEFTESENESSNILNQAIMMFSLIANTFGIPAFMPHIDKSTETPYHVELQEICHRALNVQSNRNKRSSREV